MVRALSERLPYPLLPEERGNLLETLILNEIRAYISYEELRYPLFFYRSYDRAEVDFLFETYKGYVAIEVKSAALWRKKFNRGLHKIAEDLGTDRVMKVGVFDGDRPLLFDDVRVFPVKSFLQALWSGELFAR